MEEPSHKTLLQPNDICYALAGATQEQQALRLALRLHPSAGSLGVLRYPQQFSHDNSEYQFLGCCSWCLDQLC